MKKKLIGIGILAVVSVCVALYNNSNFKNDKAKNTAIEKKVESKNITESTKETIKNEDDMVSESENIEGIIWIKNLTFLAKDQNYDVMMNLKSKLNTELKTLDKNIYEVNLIEDTYKKSDKGFSIEATADKLKGKIYISYSNYEFNFTIKK